MGTLIPRVTSQTLAGQEVKKPMIMFTCIRSQKAAELGIRWSGEPCRRAVRMGQKAHNWLLVRQDGGGRRPGQTPSPFDVARRPRSHPAGLSQRTGRAHRQ